MFGMALKFLELGLEPLNILRNSDVSNRQTFDSENDKNGVKKSSNSSEDIKASKNAYPLSREFQKSDPYQQKENQPQEKLKNSRINISEEDLEELKQSQKKILEDLKRSISRSLSSSQNLCESQENYSPFHSAESKKIYEKVGGLVLSKIEELSEEYLEYSIRKQEFANHQGILSPIQQNLDSHSKSVSCELIKSIVKSVLLDGSDQKDDPSGFSSVKNSQFKEIGGISNFETYESSGRSFQMNETATEFIRDLFLSLGLINEELMQSNSLKELTLSAKKNFNQLKGSDYVQKLHKMLKSVENMEHQTSKLKLQKPLKVSYFGNQNFQVENQLALQNFTENKKTKSRKEILIKREEDKKVKLVSPETFSQLQARRNTIEKEIAGAVQFLTKTRRARKFAFHTTRISQVYINFSMDFKFMSYKQVESPFFTQSNFYKILKQICSCRKGSFSEVEEKEDDKMTILSLPWNLVNVSKGIKTRNLIKYEELLANDEKKDERQGLHQERCLSLLFKNRTYDFEFESNDMRDQYFRAIKTMIKSSFDL